MRRAACLLVLAAVAAAAPAGTVYKHVMPDGSVRFSDTPEVEGAASSEPVEVQPVQTIPPPPQLRRPLVSADDDEGGYREFAITSPEDGAALRDNPGNLAVKLAVAPRLRRGDVIEVSVNGETVGSGRSTSVMLSNLDRGSHTVAARILDRRGEEVARADPVTFSLQRTSVNQPARRASQAPPAGGGGG